MKIFDPKLTGSIAFENAVQGNIEITGDLVVPGSITAREFKTEFVSASIIYQSGSTQFGNSADDTHVFTGRITQNDGNLGIGTVATTAHIHEASTGVANLKLTELGAGGSAQIYLENTVETFELGADASPQGFYIRALNDPNGYGQATFFLNASGSIGIGITEPQSRIHIGNTGGVDNIPLLAFSEDGNNEFGFKGHFSGTGDTGNSFEFYSFWSDNILRFLGNGNVGIGTNSPAKKLDVYGGDIQVHNTTPYLIFRNTVGGTHTIRRENDSLVIREGSPLTGDRMTIQSGGYVGLGTSTPGTALHVWQTAPIISMTDSNSFTDPNDRFQIRAGSNEGLLQWWDDSAGTTITHMVFESDGNVGVGTTNAIRGFHVNSGVLIGNTYTQPAGSGWSDSNTQVIIGGSHNSGFNNDNPGVKLLITGHNNDSANIYPIYVEDENGLLDFYIKGRTSGAGRPWGVFAGDLSVGTTTNRATLEVEGSIQQTSRSRIITFTKAIGDNVGTDIAGFTGGDPSGATILVTIVVNASAGYAVKTLRYLWNIRRATAGTSRNVVELTGADLGSVNSGVVSVGSTAAVALFNSYERFRFSVNFSGVAVSTLYVKMEALGDNVSGLNPI